MKKRNAKINKGAPSGFIISIIIHAAAFLLAGMLVVFNVVQKQEKKFVPPKPVDRPKMKLKKPKVKVKKSARPKSTTRIVTKVQKASMPDIQLPEMSGIGAGLAGDIGGFDIMPDLDEVSIFGSSQSIGNDFVGTFYDTKRFRNGSDNAGISREETIQAILNFMKRGWKPSAFSKYYKSPRKLYTTTFMFPQVPATVGPEAFGEKDIPGYGWIAHYKGQLVYPEDARIRFWAQGDNLICVRVNGKIVNLASWPGWNGNNENVESHFLSLWDTPDPSMSRRYPLGNNYAVVGDWIDLKAGEPQDMEVIVSEMSGGITCFLLCVEMEGKEYDKNPFGLGPKLHAFKTERLSLDLKEQIWAHLHETDALLEGGPVFNDINGGWVEVEHPEIPEHLRYEKIELPPDAVEPTVAPENGIRAWTLKNGKVLEAEYTVTMGDSAVFKTARGKQIKVPVSELSEESISEMQLLSPPEFIIDFRRTTRQLPTIEVTPYWDADPLPPDKENIFGVRMKQKGREPYDHPLTVKYYAIGAEVDGDNWVLLDRREETVIPSQLENHEFSFLGEPVRTRVIAIRDDGRAPLRGVEYGGHLITVTDERGVIIQYRCSPTWLIDIKPYLDLLPVGKHFDKTGNRVSPPRPNDFDRPKQFWD
ncbi:hypothetical protein EGM51_05235 [Verrucomicrobia bacterium S94]|nr:hypothetical protein EGM51_05235 [Verrucomicrobia bacterium S94]